MLLLLLITKHLSPMDIAPQDVTVSPYAKNTSLDTYIQKSSWRAAPRVSLLTLWSHTWYLRYTGGKVAVKHWDSWSYWYPSPPKSLVACPWLDNTDSHAAALVQHVLELSRHFFKALPHSFEYLKYLCLWKEDVIYGRSWVAWSQVWQGGQDGWS